jgi:hypothetical protein
MINLLPQNEKALNHKEYRYRAIAVCLGVVFVLCVIAGVLLIPSYILSFSRRKAAESMLNQPVSQTQEQNKILMNQIEKAKAALIVLAPDAPAKYPTDIVKIITKHKTENITVNSIVYSYKKPNLVATVKGMAKTRQSLIAFKTAIEQEQGIAEIVLPIGILAKDSNLEFSFEIKNKQ